MENEIHNIVEGVSFDKERQTFLFDFGENQTRNVILSRQIHHIEAFGRCFYYGYEFSKEVDSDIRTRFIKHIKFEESFQKSEDCQKFIGNAVLELDKAVTLPKFKAFVYPESMSEINRKMLANLTRIASPEIIEIELIKEIPQNIEFDYNRFCVEILDAKLPNGCPRYREQAKEDAISSIREMMESIHRKDYFSIARDIKKSKYRQYIKNFYKFKDMELQQAYEKIQNENVLLFDDIVTSGSTMYLLLNCLRCINDTNEIVIFSLIGNDKVKDI